MRSHILLTPQVFNNERPIRFVSYSRDSDSLFVMVTHAATWELRGMRRVTLEDLVQQFPECAQIEFDDGDHLLELNSATNTWSAVSQ